MEIILFVVLLLPVLCPGAEFHTDPTEPTEPANIVETSTDSLFETTQKEVPKSQSGRLTKLENEQLRHSCGKYEKYEPILEHKSIGSSYAIRAQAPWVVAVSKIGLGVNGTETIATSCSGTLISSRHVLTARHCKTKRRTPLSEFRFVFDDDCAASSGTSQNCSIAGAFIRKAVKAFAPKEWRRVSEGLDLIVFEMDEPVPIMGHLYPACLAGSLPQSLDVLQLFSFGNEDPPNPHSKKGSLQKISMTVLPCLYNRTGVDNFCTISTHQRTYHGDSGGGFISVGKDDRHSVVGVVSGGEPVTTDYLEVIQTAVAPHLEWICKYVGICVKTKEAQLKIKINVIHA